MKFLAAIKTEVDRLAGIIEASGYHALPTYGRTEDFARPHIEVDSRGYHLVVVERGQELERFTTRQLDDLLYRIFQSVTFSLAIEFELAHRIETKDGRRLMFQKQEEFISRLSKLWADRLAKEHECVLREYPFDDCSGIRANLTRELREAGQPPQTAWQMALERYPLPMPARAPSSNDPPPIC